MSDDMSEVKHLLEEIRDLLKADVEMTKEFRKAALARRQAGDEDSRRHGKRSVASASK